MNDEPAAGAAFDEITNEFAGEASRRAYAAWNSGEADKLVSLCHHEVLWEDPGIEGGRLVGIDPLRWWLEETFAAFPDLTFEPDGPLLIAVDGRSFGQQWLARATMRGPFRGMAPTQRSVTMTGVDIHAYREGALARVYTVYDRLPVSVQLGAMPEPGSPLGRLGVRMQHLSARRMRKHRPAD